VFETDMIDVIKNEVCLSSGKYVTKRTVRTDLIHHLYSYHQRTMETSWKDSTVALDEEEAVSATSNQRKAATAR